MAAACGIGMLATPAGAAKLFPWILKSQDQLTHAECLGAMRHDSNYWWSRGACHMKFIRDAAGVVLRDISAPDNSKDIQKQGELFEGITQYRPKEGLYCGHGAGCYPSKDIKLLGSVLTGPYSDEKAGDETDLWQGVGTSCELILADKAEIIKAGAQKLLKDCH